MPNVSKRKDDKPAAVPKITGEILRGKEKEAGVFAGLLSKLGLGGAAAGGGVASGSGAAI